MSPKNRNDRKDARKVAKELNWPTESTFKILISTDNHLGYMENDNIRSNDSFHAFEEILQLATNEQVDFILLAGDLFHENKPSRETLYRTMCLLRAYCLGDKPCQINFLSDPSINFQDSFTTVNYMDPNFNVAIPIFSIHGNHDDPSGNLGLAALDLLSVSGLTNYFGKVRNIDDITLDPILLEKGQSKLALYGLGNVRDEQLLQTWSQGRVEINRPEIDPENWFNILALHQNHVPRGTVDYLPERYLSSAFDLVIWGHEHECLIDPKKSLEANVYVSQPGSSVATSLCPGEAVRKHVAIGYIHQDMFRFEKYVLKTVRPMIFRDITIKELPEKNPDTELKKIIESELESMLEEADQEWIDIHRDSSDKPPILLPLLRLRIQVNCKIDRLNVRQYVQNFTARVANPNDLIRVSKSKKMAKNDLDPLKKTFEKLPRLMTTQLEALMLEDIGDYKPSLVSGTKLGEAVHKLVTKDENNLIKDVFKSNQKIYLKSLTKEQIVDDNSRVREAVTKLIQINDKKKPVSKMAQTVAAQENEPEQEVEQEIEPVQTKIKSRGGGKKTTTTTTSRTTRASKRPIPIPEPSNSENEEPEVVRPTNSRGRPKRQTAVVPESSEVEEEKAFKPASNRGRPKRQAAVVPKSSEVGELESVNPINRSTRSKRQAIVVSDHSDAEVQEKVKSINRRVQSKRLSEVMPESSEVEEEDVFKFTSHNNRLGPKTTVVQEPSEVEELETANPTGHSSQSRHEPKSVTTPNFDHLDSDFANGYNQPASKAVNSSTQEAFQKLFGKRTQTLKPTPKFIQASESEPDSPPPTKTVGELMIERLKQSRQPTQPALEPPTSSPAPTLSLPPGKANSNDFYDNHDRSFTGSVMSSKFGTTIILDDNSTIYPPSDEENPLPDIRFGRQIRYKNLKREVDDEFPKIKILGPMQTTTTTDTDTNKEKRKGKKVAKETGSTNTTFSTNNPFRTQLENFNETKKPKMKFIFPNKRNSEDDLDEEGSEFTEATDII